MMRGAGLGTRLFTWARCALYAQEHGVPMLAPRWVQPRLGPLLRGGIDMRSYTRQILLLGLFKAAPGDITGLQAARLRARAPRLPEPERWQQKPSTAAPGTGLVVFSGYGQGFQDLNGYDHLLLECLRAITQERWLTLVDQVTEPFIGINVRLGNDFRTAQSTQDYYTKGAIKTPLDWYIASLQQVRRYIGQPVKAIVVSDGTPAALSPLLELENVSFWRPGCAISDLLTLGKAKVLLAAGGSSFSAWAAFLGQMPTISHPGQSLTWFKLANRHKRFVGEFNPAAPDHSFLDQAQQSLLPSSRRQ
jgi:hypothetical protein